MNTDELIVMGVLIVLAGALMAARHLINNLPTDHGLWIARNAPMATRKVDTGNTEEVRLIPRMEHIEEIDTRIAELEQRHERVVQNYEDLIAAQRLDFTRMHQTFKQRIFALERRIAKLED